MRMRRLGWAGLEIESHGRRLVIDYARDLTPLFPQWKPGTALAPPSGTVTAALVTHLHRDHTDAAALADVLAPGAPVLRPAPGHGDEVDNVTTLPAERELALHRLATEVVDAWSTREIGPFRITAVPAVDGLGDPQLNWVVQAGGQRVFHGGDTMFHGYWWRIARRFSPFDAVFLPANGAVVDAPHLQPPSPLPAALDPHQAAAAAQILNARYAVPMHYETEQPDKDTGYVEVTDPEEEFRTHAGERARVLAVGEWLDLSA
ncbi:L-ascorbate metabolism protein UlaG, beta-lactamase superfamily [Saccharopolyspora antimicrobica]|uniref:L-ascorbate metabolism protein UlaG (Beta-lactamase superfamily) n=1 Tax=Saccharopolyspora antimicrobica TaxID=455193 RepID=A0A1I4RII6_9PSEU|nr:MBL fold metallo-hydrolase [Saccharopolyspora antimicrobica]RKT88002.1 L-ascorbate metabolism protein UlaG (beta-lactamase superfamily) [Saccharopolyspora antimicrobica]SFM51856.1 L-ascorbate metabolism protein UlaG, beta-lactamase superfamily [Saccharopolyspora antimicrobica]